MVHSGPNQVPNNGSSGYGNGYRLHLVDYIQQSREALESQRIGFERERVAFSEERKLWGKERNFLRWKIICLEQQLCDTMAAAQPIPNTTDRIQGSFRVWEGSNPVSNPTRTFLDGAGDVPRSLNNDLLDLGHSPSLDEALSPKSRPTDRVCSIGIPVEMLDSSLDGITLKSTGLPLDIAAKLTSPLQSNLSSPPPVLSPNPTRTDFSRPRVRFHDGCGDIEPTHPEAQPTQNDESYSIQNADYLARDSENRRTSIQLNEGSFDATNLDLDEDPELTGALMLQNDEEHDMGFLEELDQKLLREARKALIRPMLSDADSISDAGVNDTEPEPGIRFKNSTNFGSAFGSTQPGGLLE
ncbi:hypothetical protein FQN57_004083 [Myotisia sp. PD_48]|nr:hypothetical protein FQN57_004083 [Myotisia sp. PD_48]